jgi:tetratricopeptide (TPR) repeat protein
MRCLAILLLLGSVTACVAQSVASNPDQISAAQQLFSEEKWPELLHLLEPLPVRSPDLDYFYGAALAQVGRWDEARKAFLQGRHLAPGDKRFAIELAGVDFKQKRYAQAAAWLRRALQLDPNDTYARDFLGSVYFLQGNIEAALKYWNRSGKPDIAAVRLDPVPHVRPALLDRAFAFSPAGTLRLRDLLTSDTRIRGLGIFPAYSFDLAARPDRKFDISFRAQERNGWAPNKWRGLVTTFRGLFYQTFYAEFFNLDRSATNLLSMARWDAQKRRALTSLSGPIRNNPKWRYGLALDLRNENWDIRDSSAAANPLLASLNLRKEAMSARVVSYNSGRWGWLTGAEFSHRDYRNIAAAFPFTPTLIQGYQLKHIAQVNYELLRVPDRRFVTTGRISSQAARVWSQPQHSFAKLQSSVDAHWFPQARGDDYEMQTKIRAGRTFGQAPFDELFMLGVERDNDLWLRAHAGTHDGRKGSAPLGRGYFLSNWETDKRVYSNGLVTFKLGPFLDTGRITGKPVNVAREQWLWDTGVQAKISALGVQVTLLYGKDLRSGRNIFYVTTARHAADGF